MIISLSGIARSGKDTFADIVTSKFNFEKISLADPLRTLCSEIFDIPTETFLSNENKAKLFDMPIILEEFNIDDIAVYAEDVWDFTISDSVLQNMRKNTGAKLLSPRHVLQFIGTEVLRSNIDPDIFLKLADKQIEKTTKNVVITDARFSNERQWFKNKEAMLFLIKRPSITTSDLHISENDLGEDNEYDVVFNNDSTIGGFKISVCEYINYTLLKRKC